MSTNSSSINESSLYNPAHHSVFNLINYNNRMEDVQYIEEDI